MSIIPAIIIILKIVPKPGFCLINIHKKSTDTLIKKVAVPIDKFVVLDIPSASTDHGEFPVVDKIKSPSPNPKIIKPKIKKKDVDNFGLKLKELSELQDTIGIFLIFKNIFNKLLLLKLKSIKVIIYEKIFIILIFLNLLI